MKTLITIILLSIQLATFGQAANQAGSASAPSSLIYSEDEDALIYKDTIYNPSAEIVIESLPGYGKEPIPVQISQKIKGKFTFKKHPSLLVPEYYSVVIEDNLTGAIFDLKNSESYSFSVNRAMPDRFVLRMDKIKNTQTAMR